MAKTTKTFSLEGDIIDKIIEYKKENKLSSDSAALERIMLAFSSGSNNSIVPAKIDNIEGLLSELLTRIDTKNNNYKDIEAPKINSEESKIVNLDMPNTLSSAMAELK